MHFPPGCLTRSFRYSGLLRATRALTRLFLGGNKRFVTWLLIGGASGFLAFPAAATTRTWTGAVNPYWSEPGNWSPHGAPRDGDAVVFPGSAVRYDSQNDMTNRHLSSILLSGGGYQLTGTTVYLASDLTDNHTTGGGNSISFMIYFDGPGLINVVGAQKGALLDLYNQVRLDSHTSLTLFVDAFDGSGNPGYLTLHDAVVNFNGPVIKRGNGVLYFQSGNPNVYYGGMFLLEGTTHLLGNKPVSEEYGTGYVTIGSNGVSQATVYVGGTPWAGQVSITVNDSHLVFQYGVGLTFLRLHEGALVDGPGTLTIYSGLESSSDNLTPVINLPLIFYPASTYVYVHGANYFALDLQTSISGQGGIYKSGNAPLLLQHPNSFTGNITVTEGILDVYTPTALGAGTNVILSDSGSLLLRNSSVTGKMLENYTRESISSDITGGVVTSIGSSSWNGPIVLHTNLVVLGGDMNFTGPISGPGGLVFLNGVSTISGADGNTFTGATLVRSSLLQFNKPVGVKAYAGPLVVGGPFGGPYEVRWLQDYQNVYADVTLYANGLVNLNNHRDDFGPIHFTGGSIAIGAGELGVYDVVTINPAAVPALISGNLGLPPGYREFRVADGSAQMDLQMNATVLGAGHLYKTGPGQLWLNAANTYSGLTLVGEGTLVANAIGALGTTASGTIVLDGATLAFNFLNSTVGELISLRGAGVGGTSGALNIQGTATLRSQFPSIYPCLDLTTNATIRVEGSGVLTADGFISGAGPLIKTGPGTLAYTGGYDNTYTEDTSVREGTLTLQKPIGVTAIPRHVSIGAGPGAPPATLLQQSSFSIIGQVTVNGGGLWSLSGQAEGFSSTVPPPLTLNDGGTVQSGSSGIFYLPPGGDLLVNAGSAGSVIGGNIGLDTGVHHFIVNGGGTIPGLLITANIGQTGSDAWFQKDGAGFFRFNGINTCTGTNILAAGRFQMNGSQDSGGIQVNTDAILSGLDGGGWRIIMNGGTVAPGPMPGVLRCGSFNEGGGTGTLRLEIDSTTPGSSNSKLNAYGNVNLTGLNLSLLMNFLPPTNAQFIVLENATTGPTLGNFNGLPQNATLHAGDAIFRINYAGNTGNDVVLTDISSVFHPGLAIERGLPGSVRLFWSTNDPAFGLQFATNSAAPNWQPVAGTPGVLGTNFVLTNSASGRSKVYRLFKP